MSAPEVPGELIALLGVFAEGGSLREWFDRLEEISEGDRVAELLRVAARMEAGGEEAAVVNAVRLLAHPEIFRGAHATLAQ